MKSNATSNAPEQQRWLWAESFLAGFFRLAQALKIHESSHPFVGKGLKEWVETITMLQCEDDRLTIRIREGRLFLQEEKLNLRPDGAGLLANFVNYFEQRKLHGISLAADLRHIEADELIAFVNALNAAEGQDDPERWLEQELRRLNLDWVEILHDPQVDSRQTGGHAGVAAGSPQPIPGFYKNEHIETGKNAYAGTLTALKDIAANITSNRPGGIRKALRTVQNMVDLILEDDYVLLGLSTLRDFDDYTYVHSVNTGILAMTLGSRIGLSRDALELLGICGLFHDLGKIEIPIEIIHKPNKLTGEEFEEIKKHVLNSVRLILKLRAGREIRSKILIGPFEHHLKYDLSGYPQTRRKKPLSLYGRIISIADVYDALTSPRIYRGTAISPRQALAIMIKGAGTDFDPILLKVFIKMIGIYPIGTLLKFDSGEIGLVAESSDEIDPMRPRVVLLKKDSSKKYKRGATVSLCEKHLKSGAYKRNIVASHHPCLYGIQPAQYLI